jgi:hypothetical protein
MMMRFDILFALAVAVSALGCHQSSPVKEATQPDTILIQHDAQALNIPLLERQRFEQLPRIRSIRECTFEITPGMDIHQESPVLMIDRTAAYEETTTHLTALSIKSVNAQGCRLSVTAAPQSQVSYLRMGAAQHSIAWMRVPVTLSYECPKLRGSHTIMFRGDHIISDRMMCDDHQMMYLKPDAHNSDQDVVK